MLITFAPLVTAQLIPFARPELEPTPLSLRTLPSRMLHAGHTPATPMVFSEVAATVPDTCVPWP